ncbi:hypothetical protein [Paenibacillus sp. NPDC057967]|uniref:hypothetical protein n=1 Tax=Paenibacillus sp. NPDC057967 TaxID=3346293 RepID=UPI0036D98619
MKLDGLYADEWAELSSENKQERVVKLLAETQAPFDFEGIKVFSAHGVMSETALLDWKGRKFVFVPGKKSVVLGWDGGIDGMDERTRQEIDDGFEEVLDPLSWWRKQLADAKASNSEHVDEFERRVAELEAEAVAEPASELQAFYSMEGLNAYINEHTSPVRTADLPPMIVECELNEVGLVPVGYVDRGKREHQIEDDFLEQVENYLYDFNTESVMTEYSGTCRFQRSEADPMVYGVYAFDYTTREDLQTQLQAEGFALPTEDQWEYLCGLGQCTLFPFGGRFDEEGRYSHLSETGENVLEQPNGLGVTIAYDPYKYEIVDSECLVKGGDGGNALCGGEPFIYMMLPLAAYWRDAMASELLEDEDLASGFYFYRRVFVVE